jgi:hypothetical protein
MHVIDDLSILLVYIRVLFYIPIVAENINNLFDGHYCFSFEVIEIWS